MVGRLASAVFLPSVVCSELIVLDSFLSICFSVSFSVMRNPLVYNDFVYGLTKNGRRFKEQCDFVHEISERVIRERRQSLVSVCVCVRACMRACAPARERVCVCFVLSCDDVCDQAYASD